MFLCFLLGAFWVGAKNHVNMSSAHAPHLRWNWPPFWCCWTCWMRWKSWVTIVGTGRWSGNPGLVAPKNWLVKMLFLTISGGGTWCPAAWVCCIIGYYWCPRSAQCVARLHHQRHVAWSSSWTCEFFVGSSSEGCRKDMILGRHLIQASVPFVVVDFRRSSAFLWLWIMGALYRSNKK